LTQKINEDELRKLLRTLFRHSDQVNYVLEFINRLYKCIHIHSKHAAISVEQPQTKNVKVSHFLPGDFQINLTNVDSGVAVDQFPFPSGSVDNIVYKDRRIYAEQHSLTIRYCFTLSNYRASVSVRPQDVRDRSPVRNEEASSSSSSSPSSSPKKRGLFSLW
jgi:hypothetical protein